MQKKLDAPFELQVLGATDKQLEKLSKDRTLGMSLDEMKRMQKHFEELGRNPTDVEAEALGQAWSEHCSYKSSKPVLKKTVFNIKAPQNISVIAEDAGVIDFDKDHAYVIGLESHNHPSALDPYGGAATGIGGIVRDVVCMGGKPLAFFDPLFFGNLDAKKVPKGTKHPRYLYKGVVQGIADYGNRLGVPTIGGMVYFDDSYTSNCLVNVGCIGIVKKKHITHSYAKKAGDKMLLAGGGTGRDGIHGVSFASRELDEKSESQDRPAVQMGDPIGKEPLIHATLEVIEKGLISGCKDLGGGGLSCVCGEMAYDGGLGARVEMEKVPLKAPNMAPWEIWVSESQERMMLAVPEKNLKKVEEIFELWDVPTSVIGEFVKSDDIVVTHKKKKVVDMKLDFYTAAFEINRPFKKQFRKLKEPELPLPRDYGEILLKLLASPNIASQEWIIRQYDHEVKAHTILKPLQGGVFRSGPGDASVLQPLEDSFKGLAFSCDVNPSFTKLDPYWGAASAVEESIRNLVAVGASPHSFVDCLNFGNPEKPDRMSDFVDATNGMYYVAKEFRVPFVSGNVSLYNEGTSSIAPTPVILSVGIMDDVRKAISSNVKKPGNFLYLLGETQDELGGSEYYKLFGHDGANVPRVNPALTKMNSNKLLSAMSRGLVESCHDVSNGGLAVAVGEMLFGSKFGAYVFIDLIAGTHLRNDVKMFSESNGRWICEVAPENVKEFENSLRAARIGKVVDEQELVIGNKKPLISLSVDELYDAWSNAIPNLVEGKK